MTPLEIIEAVKPTEILVSSVNYLQCIVGTEFIEVQKCYHTGRWYQFKEEGRADSPREVFVKWVN